MRIIEKMGYTLWYGTFILFGLTFGLLLHPLLASADVLYDSLSTTTIPTGGNTMYPDGYYFNSSAEFSCILVQPDIDLSLDTITMYVRPNINLYGNSLLLNIYDLGTATTTYPIGATFDTGFMSEAITVPSSYTFGTTTFTFAGNTMLSSHYYCMNFFDATEGSNTYEYSIGYKGGTILQNFIWSQYTPRTSNYGWWKAYKDFNDIFYQSNQASVAHMPIQVTGTTYTPPSGGGSSSTTIEYITAVYPTDGTYDVATTSYVNMTVEIPALRYEQNDWKAKIACAEVTENTWFQSLVDYGFSYTVDLTDGDCGSGLSCIPHGVSYPVNGDIQENSVYNCRAMLYEAKWYWFDTLIETEMFRFYTFPATSTSEFAELIARADELQGTVNLTGTSTNPVFGDCSILSGQISDCVIEPIKYLLIPSATDKDNIKELIDTTVFDKFPFSYVGLFNQDMASSSYFATTTTAEFPDFAFETQNMNGVTTTVTIFDGSQFVSSWSTVSEFDTLRTAIQYALIIMFTTILYFRVRRLIPSSDNVQGI